MKEIDWVPYIERKNSIFYLSLFQDAHNNVFKKFVGKGFNKQLCLWDGESYQIFLSKKELEEIKKYLLGLPDQKVEYLKAQCELMLISEKRLLNEFSFSKLDFYFDKLKNNFSLLTVIPSAFMKINKDTDYFLKFRLRTSSIFQYKIFPMLLEKLSYKTGLTSDDFFYLRYDEINKNISKKEILKRKQGCLIYFIDGKKGVSTNKELIKWAKTLRKIENKLEGNIAYIGKVKGKVCILNTFNDLKKYSGEEIIVSINTAPSLMPALVKCKGIITDEGGITSHAAIISRELKKPCIIGTKNATKILKDGDIVELDAIEGKIKKL